MDISRICWKICSAFDYDEDINPFDWGGEEGITPGLGIFLYHLIEKESLRSLNKDSYYKGLTPREKDIIGDVSGAYATPFAFGYVIGQMFDIPSPEVQREIEKIKKLLKDKALLPYLPRGKKERREL